MAMTIHVDIVSAEGAIHSGQAEMVYAPGEMGELGIAPRHTPLVTRLKPGDVRVDSGKREIGRAHVELQYVATSYAVFCLKKKNTALVRSHF